MSLESVKLDLLSIYQRLDGESGELETEILRPPNGWKGRVDVASHSTEREMRVEGIDASLGPVLRPPQEPKAHVSEKH
jgi:hypothetical protein